MKSRTELSISELYAVERAARLARSQEMARLIGAGASAFGQFVRRLESALGSKGREVSHA